MGKVKKEKVAQQVPDNKNKNHSPKKKKTSENKNTDEWSRKYFYIFPESIKCMAETVGITNLSDDAANNLAEDVSYRLRSVIQTCAKYLKHTRRKRLTCQDVNEVLQMCDIPPVIGHGVPDTPLGFTTLREVPILVLDDPLVDLVKYALNEVTVSVKPQPIVSGKWLTPDENRIKIKLEDGLNESVDGVANKSFTSNHVSNSHLKFENDSKSVENHKVPTEHVDNEPKIPTNLIKYYGITCNTILGHSDLKLVLRDLSHNGKIVPIVPYLLNFVTITLRKLGSERQLKRILQAVEALTENKNIDFTPYHPVTRVANILLKIVKTPPIETSPLTCNYTLRCRAAQILGKVLLHWCCNPDQHDTVMNNMSRLLRDPQTPTVVLVGALALLTKLGPKALHQGFWGILEGFLHNVEKHVDRQSLELALMEVAVIFYRNPYYYEKDKVQTSQIDQILYEYFGDSLCAVQIHLLENPQFVHAFTKTPETTLMKYADTIFKRSLRLPRCVNSIYNPVAIRLTIHTAFNLPKLARKRNHRIIFKFEGARPVPEMSLRRRRIDTPYSQFIAGKVSEGHVVLVGKIWRGTKRKLNSSASLFTIL